MYTNIPTSKLIHKLNINLSEINDKKYWANYYSGQPANKWKLTNDHDKYVRTRYGILSEHIIEICAPNIYEFHELLMNTYNIYVQPMLIAQLELDAGFGYELSYPMKREDGYYMNNTDELSEYSSYKEAMNEGILHALTLIEKYDLIPVEKSEIKNLDNLLNKFK